MDATWRGRTGCSLLPEKGIEFPCDSGRQHNYFSGYITLLLLNDYVAMLILKLNPKGATSNTMERWHPDFAREQLKCWPPTLTSCSDRETAITQGS